MKRLSRKDLFKSGRARCPECDTIRDLDKFYLYSSGKYSRLCKKCEKERVNEFNTSTGRDLHHIQQNKWHLKSHFGLTPEQSEARKLMGCEICLRLEHELPGKSTLGHDHCHLTGKLRGTLCTYDNCLVGHIENGTNFKNWDLRKQLAFEYIENYKN